MKWNKTMIKTGEEFEVSEQDAKDIAIVYFGEYEAVFSVGAFQTDRAFYEKQV